MNNQNTIVYVRLKGKTPPGGLKVSKPFEWNAKKDDQLWQIVSSKEAETQELDVNWEQLGQIFEDVPEKYLKQRTYSLISSKLKKLDHLKQKVNKIIDSKGSKIIDLEAQRTNLQISQYISNKNIVDHQEEIPADEVSESKHGMKTNSANSSLNGAMYMHYMNEDKLDKDDMYGEVISKLQTSKILENNFPIKFKNKLKLEDSGSIFENENEISSSLSVSASALEEALLDRLPSNINDT
ncbi:hypothetical protein TPHA_0D01370 [Tetrapisispora phaffii CBS 4417]|uniref:Autophagy-related protein 29 n=1 Tax=Tetrapisispora phaffii (strain ATCC 24235 / CBS 4417 / NBRC 1672 / NRRL Y-8282 / UCD 70-5) TaxID=1071381 RepID=G8BSF7_TETPH|nr:hypothetical protein TPHA_0D01370 [Tetrapisispora phaffii CBS 4417]CCE62778.1 hypothetical protein TPHA_0D01370 [Tetrapisispora phaffii CBS 4417]